MNAEKAVVYTLQHDSAYYALVGGSANASRVYYDELVQGTGFPQAMVTCESVEANPTKDSNNFDHDLVQVFHSAESKSESLSMATAARTALEAASGSINGVTVSEMRFVDQDTFIEKIANNKIYTTEQLFRVTVNI